MQQKTEKEATSAKILNTAYECLSANGYANVSMRNIADEAGVALSQLAYYYTNKENLFSEVINRMAAQYVLEIEAALKSASDPRDKLAALVGYFKILIKDNPKLLRLFIDFTAQALWVSSFREQLNNLYNAITEVIERNFPIGTMMVSKDLPGYTRKSVAKLAFGTLFGTTIQTVLGSDQDCAFESLNLAENLLS